MKMANYTEKEYHWCVSVCVCVKGNQSWVFIGRTDVEAEALTLWSPDVKNWLTGKDSDARNDWRQEEKGTREDEMVGCHHQLDRHEFEQAPGVGDGQGSLACCSPWGHRVGHDWVTELNWWYLDFWKDKPDKWWCHWLNQKKNYWGNKLT